MMMKFFRLFHMNDDVQTLMSSGRGNFIASSASIVAPEVATALKKEREEKAASASVVSIQDVEDTDDKETKAELARLRAEHNAQIATDAAQAVAQRLEFIRRHTDLLLHFSSKAPTAASKSGFSGGRKSAGRMSEKEEDEKLVSSAQSDGSNDLKHQRLQKQPSIIINGELREYQLEGVNWLVHLYNNGISGILADEMGLGKTVQSIAMMAYLKEFRKFDGPFLVIVPKSTVNNWMKEFVKWCPVMRVVRFHGDGEERAHLNATQIVHGKFDAVVTTYEVVNAERTHLMKFNWRYLVIDEAHRIKNDQSLLSTTVRMLNSQCRLLLTGTPLQNNLHELWALLNFLLPDEFHSADEFNEFFSEGDTSAVTTKLHKILRPFLLRRLKADVEKSLPPKKEINVYVPMSRMQRKLYTDILKKDIDAINGTGGTAVRLLNVVMQLRKCCNHPYLFDGQEPGPPYVEGEHLVYNASKLVLLDKLLVKFKAQGSRCLVFCQMTRMLDILEDYCLFRGYKYSRIDGQISGEVRDEAIESFMAEGSEKFIFLLSTRAGGLGLNLWKADQVVLYDSDWNPQMDIQAMDRAHRIGQTKPVFVYRFVMQGAIEEKIQERAFKKLFLDAVVIQQGRLVEKMKGASREELLDMIRFGAEEVVRLSDENLGDFDVDELLRSAEQKTEQDKAKIKEMTEKSFSANFSMDGGVPSSTGTFTFDGKDYKDTKKNDGYFLDFGARERKLKSSLNVDASFREQMMQAQVVPKKSTGPRVPKYLQLPQYFEYQFFNVKRLMEINEKKKRAWQASIDQGIEQDFNDEYGMEPHEIAEERALKAEGFDWTRRDFMGFRGACERHGRHNHKAIAEDLEKPLDEVKRYASVFWSRIEEVPDYKRIVSLIEKGESKIQKRQEAMDAVSKKVSKYAMPWQQMRFQYGQLKGKTWTEDEDRFIICMSHRLGYGRWEELKWEIRKSWNFRFDWFIKSRKPAELESRFKTLVRVIQKELEGEELAKKTKKRSAAAAPEKADAKESSAKKAKK